MIRVKIKTTMQYQQSRETAKISALSSSKMDKYEYFTGKAVLSHDQSKVIEPATFTLLIL